MKNKKKITVSLVTAFAMTLGGAFAMLSPVKSATAESNTKVFDFTAATSFEDVSMFSVGIDPAVDDANMGYNAESWVTYARDMDDIFTLDNGLKVNTSVYSGDACYDNRIYVRYNTEMMQYFQAEMTYSYDDTARFGWAGLIFGYTNYERQARWGDSPYGAEFFVQNDGKGTYASSKLVAEYGEGATAANWEKNGEHTLKVVADENGIVFSADGTVVNSLTTEEMEAKGYVLSEGSVGFMLTNAQFTVKSFKVTDLSEGGTVEEEKETYEINNDFTAITSLDQVQDFYVGIDPQMDSEDYIIHSKTISELFTLENGLKINTSLYGADSVTENIVYGRYKDTMKYFKAEMTYSYDNVRNGWAGFVLGFEDYEHKNCWPNNPHGIELFVQNNGLGTYCGNVISGGGYVEGVKAAGWTAAADHTLSIVVDENGIVFTADGTVVSTITPEQMAAKNYELIEGGVGFMFTNAQFTLKSFNITCLDEQEDDEEVVEETYLENYDFTAMTSFDSVSMFSAGIDPATNNSDLGYTSDGWVTYARDMDNIFTLDNGLKVNTSVYSGNDVSENNIYVRYNTKKLTYFKAELTYTYDDANANGWAGFILGYTNYDRKARWGDSPNGIEFFVQNNGLATYSSGKLNNSGYSETSKPSGWEKVGQHTLKIVADGSGITFSADGTVLAVLTTADLAAKGYTLDLGNVGFMFTNAPFTAKSFKISPLNAAGEEYVAVESVEVSAATEVNQFEALEVTTAVLPENAALKTVRYELPAGAVEVNGKIYFAAAGTYTLKAIADDNANVYDEFTVTVNAKPAYANHQMTDSNYDTYFVTSGGSKDGMQYAMENYWTHNEDGTITLTEKKGSGVDSGYVLLYLKDVISGLTVKTNSFEIVYMVKSSASTPNGWHGVGFALADRATVPNQNGVSAFIQEEARKATIWGSGVGGVGGPSEVDSLYTRGEWNMIKVRVYGQGTQKVEMYVNDMATPVITTTGVELPVADLALFTTTTITIGNVYFANLDKDGNAIQTVYPESVAFENAPTTAEVGDQVQLVANVTPANVTDGGVLFISSNALVATVNSDGLVTFLGVGETTITVKCKANPSVYAELTITVAAKEILPTSVSFDNIPTTAEVGGKYTLFVTVLPEETSNYAVTFTSSNTDVATVDADGRLTFVGAGETVITVTCVADETISASFTLTVTQKEEPPVEEPKTDDTTSILNMFGCSGSIVGGMAAISMLAAAAVLLKKKED